MRKDCMECKDRISARVKYVVTCEVNSEAIIAFKVGPDYAGKKFKVMVMEEIK